MNIMNFMNWFITQFITIGTNLINQLDSIKLNPYISLLDFTITITIIGMFLPIILTIPNNVEKWSRAESKAKVKESKK